MAEVYAFARIEPLDEPLQQMLAELTSVLARVHGNNTSADDFKLALKSVTPADDRAQRTDQIMAIFAKAAKANSIAMPRRRQRKH